VQSIRRRLTLPPLLGTAVLVLTIQLGLNTWIVRRLSAEYDRALRAAASTLQAVTEQESGGIEFEFTHELMPEFQAANQPEYFQVWLTGGTVVARSESLGRGDLPRSPRPAGVRFADLRLPDGRRGRMIELAFVPLIEGRMLQKPFTAVLVVARSREDLDTLIRSLNLAAFDTAALLAAGLGLLIYTSVRSGLAPLATIQRQVTALDAARLDSRIAVQPPTLELVPIIDQLNRLLARLEDAFERERRFSSAVAHELRTPVAELCSLAEIGGRWPDDRPAVEEFFRDVGSIGRQMKRTVATLLTLARSEGGIEGTTPSDFSLPELISEQWAPLASAAAEKGRDFQLRSEPAGRGARVVTDREKLGLILGNLLANAASYSPTGSTIACTVRQADDAVEVTVANPAPHLAESDLSHLFERFWRKDPARTDSRHSGLGLALARSLALLLHLELTTRLVADPDGPGQSLEIRLAGIAVASP
jgi:signal transduction histidine kinase